MPSSSENSNESNVLIELNSGIYSVLLYICTIKGQMHEYFKSQCLHRDNCINKSLVLQYLGY